LAWLAALTIAFVCYPRLTVAVVIAIVYFTATGCTTLSHDEQEWRKAMVYENWELCEMVYEDAGLSTIHRNHTHRRGGRVHGMDRLTAARLDLRDNQCRQVLGDYWAQ
jgi:hypothetical protein